MDTQIQTQTSQMVEAPDFSEVIRALQVIVKTDSQAARAAEILIRWIRHNQALPYQETFDVIVEMFFGEGQRMMDAKESELIASLLTASKDYQSK